MNDLARLDLHTRAGCLIAAVAGEVDMSNVADLGDALRAALGTHPEAAVLDLTDVAYLDSAAVALVDDLAGTSRTAHLELRVVAPSNGVAGRALALSGLDAVLALDETVEDALSAACR